MSEYCNRYVDDAPGIRAECERHINSGRKCKDCPNRNTASEIARLRAEVEQWRTWGIIEIAVRNPSVAEYMRHWEGRAEKAEREVERLRLYEHIEGQHSETGRIWTGPRHKLPPGYAEVSNESGEPGPRAALSEGTDNDR